MRSRNGPRTPIAAAALVLAIVLAGCGGGGDTIDPAALDTCEQVADAAVVVIQDSIEAMDAAASGTEPDPEQISAIEALGRDLEERARGLGCSDEEMTSLMVERAGDLHAESVLGQSIIEGLRAGDGGFYGDG